MLFREICLFPNEKSTGVIDICDGAASVYSHITLVSSFSYIGDCSLPKACAMFVQEYGETIVSRNLFHNFLLHVVNLYDFGLVRHDTVTRTMMQLYWLQNRLATTGKSEAEPQESVGCRSASSNSL